MGHNCLADQWGQHVDKRWRGHGVGGKGTGVGGSGWGEVGGEQWVGSSGWEAVGGGAVGGRQREGFYSKILLRLVVVQSIKLITISMKLLGTILN